MAGKKGKSGIYIRTKECRKNMSLSHQKPLSLEHRKNVILATIKKWENPEYKKRVSQKISLALKGRVLSEKHKKRISETHWDCRGSNNPAWKGGIAYEPYGIEFNNKLKEYVKKRDSYECQYCNRSPKTHYIILVIHHIDNNKKNNTDRNLISLCRSCHAKKHWEEIKNVR